MEASHGLHILAYAYLWCLIKIGNKLYKCVVTWIPVICWWGLFFESLAGVGGGNCDVGVSMLVVGSEMHVTMQVFDCRLVSRCC